MEPISAILTLKALDGLALRAEATAQNIANAGTPNYRPVAVSFEAALAQAAKAGGAAVETVQPQVAQAPTLLGGDPGVRIDLELATASATQARYSALIEVLSRQLILRDLVVAGGR